MTKITGLAKERIKAHDNSGALFRVLNKKDQEIQMRTIHLHNVAAVVIEEQQTTTSAPADESATEQQTTTSAPADESAVVIEEQQTLPIPPASQVALATATTHNILLHPDDMHDLILQAQT